MSLNSESLFALRRRQQLSLVNKLRALGAQADLDLPRISVIGNQSAGKSSLVEAISGISVPRDAGTCTRCPIECCMTNSPDPWACRVFIRWEFDSRGGRRDPVQELAFGEVLTDPKDVELALRRAQAAVLNPSAAADRFAAMPEDDLGLYRDDSELTFSRNAVRVDLSGPGLPDLAFVDLPGIIQNAEQSIVRLVESLVLSHIRGNCLILVTLPMSDDIENQKAMSLAKQVDPEGTRTIGVLTKPDTLTSGATRSKELWLDILEGRDMRHPLRLGYFCTRQPDEDERRAGITNAQARRAEAEFFSRTPPWSLSSRPANFGTPNLVASLGKLLTRVIEQSLPAFSKETTRQLQECTTQLDSLPPQITEPASFVLSLLTRFCQRMHAHVEGQLDAAALVQQARAIYTRFKRDIHATAPPFVPSVSKDAEDVARACRALQYSGIYDEDDDEDAPEFAACVYLDDVRTRINSAVTRELPNNTPYVAKVSLIQDFQENWAPAARVCVHDVYLALQTSASELITAVFSPYTHLEPHIRFAVEALVHAKLADAQRQVQKMLKYETAPFTQNNFDLSESKDEFLALYKRVRREAKSAPAGAQTARLPPRRAQVGDRNDEVSKSHMKPTVQKQGAAEAVAAASTHGPVSPPAVAPAPTPAPVPTLVLGSAPSQVQVANAIGLGFPAKPSTPYACPGTIGNAMWTTTPLLEGGVLVAFISLSCMPEYQKWSHEELRLADYQRGRAPQSIRAAPGSANGFANATATATANSPSTSVEAGSPFRRQVVQNPPAATIAPTAPTSAPSATASANIIFGSRPVQVQTAPTPAAPTLFPSTTANPTAASTGLFGQSTSGSASNPSKRPAASGAASESSTPSSGSPASTQAIPNFFGGSRLPAPIVPTAPTSLFGAVQPATTVTPSSGTAPSPVSSRPFQPTAAMTVSSTNDTATTRQGVLGLSREERRREEAAVLASLAKLGYQGLTAADFGKLVRPDEYEHELEVMAEVRAYFKVAYKRVTDNVPLAIDYEFLRAFSEDLQECLLKHLGLGAADAVAKCAAYLEEDPFNTARREELLARKKRLESVQEELLRFGI